MQLDTSTEIYECVIQGRPGNRMEQMAGGFLVEVFVHGVSFHYQQCAHTSKLERPLDFFVLASFSSRSSCCLCICVL